MRRNAVGGARRAVAQALREAERLHHADRNRLAMQQPAGIAGRGFQRMAECVAEIEERAHAGFGFVLGDDARLGQAARVDGVDARLRRRRAKMRGAALLSSHSKKAASPSSAIFRDLGIAGGQFARAAACRAARCRRRRRPAGGRRRSGSCRAAN